MRPPVQGFGPQQPRGAADPSATRPAFMNNSGSEPNSPAPQGELVFGMMANLAQFESALIGERVKAGMARAKAQGKRTSRPPIPEATRTKIAELYTQGMSIKRIAKELKIAYGTAWNYATNLLRVYLTSGGRATMSGPWTHETSAASAARRRRNCGDARSS